MHTHYSPFQFATGVQVSENKVSVRNTINTLQKLTRNDMMKARMIPTTMTRAQAHSIPGSPTAFISPNSVDSMRTIHSVFAC